MNSFEMEQRRFPANINVTKLDGQGDDDSADEGTWPDIMQGSTTQPNEIGRYRNTPIPFMNKEPNANVQPKKIGPRCLRNTD